MKRMASSMSATTRDVVTPRSMRRIAVLAFASIEHIFETLTQVCWNEIDAGAVDCPRSVEVHDVRLVVDAIGNHLHRQQSIKFDTLPLKSLVAHAFTDVWHRIFRKQFARPALKSHRNHRRTSGFPSPRSIRIYAA